MTGINNPENFEQSMPGMLSSSSEVTSDKYRIRCKVADMTNLEDLLHVEDILTSGLDGKNIVILEKDKYSFQDRYFVVVTYLEKK